MDRTLLGTVQIHALEHSLIQLVQNPFITFVTTIQNVRSFFNCFLHPVIDTLDIFFEIKADTSVSSSNGSPTTTVSIAFCNLDKNSSSLSSCTKTRCTEIQTCPLLTNAPHFTRSIKSSVNSTSSSIITAAFDPSSNVTRFNPAFALIPSPTFGLP